MNWASDLPSTVNVSVVLVVNTDFRNHVDVHKLCYGPCGAIPNAVTINIGLRNCQLTRKVICNTL